MKIHSLKLTIQDIETSDHHRIAAIMGTLFLDDEEYKKNEDGNIVLDGEGDPIPLYEVINFTTSLHNNPRLKEMIQTLAVEALTLKNLEIAKENGTLSHFVQATTGQKPKRGSNRTKPKRRKTS